MTDEPGPRRRSRFLIRKKIAAAQLPARPDHLGHRNDTIKVDMTDTDRR